MNESGGLSYENHEFRVRSPAVYNLNNIYPANNQIFYKPEIQVQVQTYTNRSRTKSVEINGTKASSSSDSESRLIFVKDIILVEGQNIILILATFEDGNTKSLEITVFYQPPPKITISSPQDWSVLGSVSSVKSGSATNLTGLVERPIVITGNVDVKVDKVEINQQLADLSPDGFSFVFNDFFLHEGTNLISLVATDSEGRSGTNNITIYVDQTAPILIVEGHEKPKITSFSSIDIRGVVNDAVEGGINTPEPLITVINKSNGEQTQGEVLNKRFLAKKIPLLIGNNKLEIIATDNTNNVRTKEITVTRISVGTNRIVQFAGNYQTEPILTSLPKSFVVTAFDKAGLPLVNLPIHFDVISGTGNISSIQAQNEYVDGVNLARNLIVNTNESGIAKVWMSLGDSIGLADNVVRAYNENITEDVIFTATGIVGEPDLITISGSASTQYAETNSYTLESLTAIVLDAQRNPVRNAEVSYYIEKGDAKFSPNSSQNGQIFQNGKLIKVSTDKNGLTKVRPYVGGAEGNIQISARAFHSSGAEISLIPFNIIALTPKDEPTRLSGKVLDHTGVALSGVRLSIGRTNITSVSDAEGKFSFTENIPLGKVDLYIDGREIQVNIGGTTYDYPALHFETVVIRGHNNQLPHAIYLPPIDLQKTKLVGGNEDVTLAIPGFEGFEMIVAANSVTFPDGSRTGELVVSPVHNDRLPMVPPGGGASFSGVGWTLQPSGTRFDPPIQVKIPNVQGLKPGRSVSVVQWDHDLSTFVPMGNGVVTEDGTQIVTRKGTGISKAGWGGGITQPITGCARSYDVPTAGFHHVFVFKVSDRFLFGEYLSSVDYDRLEKQNNYEFSSYIRFSSCNDPYADENNRWEFGDGSETIGHTVRHPYQEPGEYDLVHKIDCLFINCAVVQQTGFRKDIPITVKDEDWIELELYLEHCGYSFECINEAIDKEMWADVKDTLKGTEIKWLTELQIWSSDQLDQAAMTQDISQASLFLLATTKAINELVFPTGLLDVTPVGKTVNALKIAKKHKASDEELFDMTRQGKEIVGDNYFELVKWRKLEKKAVLEVFHDFNGYRYYYPTRGRYNGFDGAVIMRLPDNTLRINILEAKAWSVNKVYPRNLTAYGLGRNPGTLDLNKNVLLDLLENDESIPRSDRDLLIDALRENDFDVSIIGLSGETTFSDDIVEAIRNIGIEGEVKFFTTTVD